MQEVIKTVAPLINKPPPWRNAMVGIAMVGRESSILEHHISRPKQLFSLLLSIAISGHGVVVEAEVLTLFRAVQAKD